MKFNKAISSTNPEIPSPFPVIIGRRPNMSAPPTGSSPIPSSPCLSQLLKAITTDHPHRSTSRQRDPIFVPSVGWVSQPSEEELQVQFNDGARLVVAYSTATVHSIRYQPPSVSGEEVGEERVYSTASSTNPLPADVRSRLEVIPKVVKCLRSRSKSPSS